MQRLERLYDRIPTVRPNSLAAYGLAVGLAAAGTALRTSIDPFVAGVQYITFFPAVIVTTLLAGVRAGALCVVLSALAAWLFVLPPEGRILVTDWHQVVTVAFFVTVAGIDVALIGALRFAIEKYRELNRDLEARVEARSAELLKTQQTLAQAQKMEAVGQLTGGLAHDSNNMLAVIVGSLDVLRRRLLRGETDVVQFVDGAMEGAQRATQLTQRLLAFTRNQPLAPIRVDLNRLVRGMSELLDRTLGERVRLECVTAGGLWPARVDPAQLENAILNLAVNARDAMPEGGALTIETGNAYLDDEYAATREEVEPGQYVMLAVTDSGVGMSSNVAERAFEPFFTTKQSGKGTGLGLSQVYGFAKQSGGHVAIYSEEGRGTTVRLYLPRDIAGAAAEPGSPATATEDSPAGGAASHTVLVVEDEDHVRRTTVASLRELGYTVLQAGSGADALAVLEEYPQIDLLFTDVVMPQMDGRKLAEAARARWPDLKVLYTTGYTRNAIVHDSRLDPDVSLIVKPFTVEQVARKIRVVMES